MHDTEIYAAQVDFAIRPEAFDEWYALLPEVRKAKVDYYIYRRDKVVALAAGLLLRWCLEQSLGRPLEEEKLSVSEFGKPFLRGQSGIHFNISHAGAYVVCVVAGREVGIDLEEIRAGDCHKIARMTFSPADYAQWETQSAQKQLDHFYHLWTLMESFSKAIGLGFSLDANEACFSDTDDADICRVKFTRQTKEEIWYVRHYHYLPGYKLALCLQDRIFPDKVNLVDLRDKYIKGIWRMKRIKTD